MVEGRERDFARVFGQEGIWPELLRRSPQFLGSTLLMELQGWRISFRLCDYWLAHEGFEVFRQQYQREYEAFSRFIAGEGLVERETLLGSFYVGESDFGEGSGLVPA